MGSLELPESHDCSESVSGAIYLLTAPPQYSFVSRDSCPKASGIALVRFVPPTGTFETLGSVSCPSEAAALMSIAISRRGAVYALPNDWGHQLYRLETSPDKCESLGFVFGSHKYAALYGGLSFVGNDSGESLYVAANGKSLADFYDDRFGRIDPEAGTFVEIAGMPNAFSSQPPLLAGTGGGVLFGYYPSVERALVRIDTQTGKLKKKWTPGSAVASASAFAVWGGEFYFFVAYGGPRVQPARLAKGEQGTPQRVFGDGTCAGAAVFRFRPKDGSTVEVAHLDGIDVRAATASTCPSG